MERNSLRKKAGNPKFGGSKEPSSTFKKGMELNAEKEGTKNLSKKKPGEVGADGGKEPVPQGRGGGEKKMRRALPQVKEFVALAVYGGHGKMHQFWLHS